MTGRPAVARDRVLQRLRSSLRDRPVSLRDPDARGLPERPMTVYPAPEGQSWATCFGARLTGLGGSFELADRASDVPQHIAHKISEWLPDRRTVGAATVLSWAPSELHIIGLEQALAELEIALLVPDEMNDRQVRDHAASLAVGLTGVEAGFANTGSVVLTPAPGRSRAASLLPLHHLVLVPLSRLHPTFEDWIVRLRREGRLEAVVRESSQVAFVTGPSNTADIELNLTLGVHGPKAVHAIVLDDTE